MQSREPLGTFWRHAPQSTLCRFGASWQDCVPAAQTPRAPVLQACRSSRVHLLHEASWLSAVPLQSLSLSDVQSRLPQPPDPPPVPVTPPLPTVPPVPTVPPLPTVPPVPAFPSIPVTGESANASITWESDESGNDCGKSAGVSSTGPSTMRLTSMPATSRLSLPPLSTFPRAPSMGMLVAPSTPRAVSSRPASVPAGWSPPSTFFVSRL